MATTDVDRAWALMEKIGTCMLITWDGERQRARPMVAHVKPDEHAIYFLTDAHDEKDGQIGQFPIVTLTFADVSGQKFVSTTGHATVSEDRAKIRELWSVFAKVWWNSPEDPNIRLLKVEPHDAELWDSPGKILAAVKMLTIAATGAKLEIGENKKVAL